MKKIKLTRGMVALVDDDNFEYLNQFNWYVCNGSKTNYAGRKITVGGKRETILMHVVINKTLPGLETDHKDGNGLNNQKSNLRTATRGQNMANRVHKYKNKSSKYKGVAVCKRVNNSREYIQIMARISSNGKNINIGSFATEEEAAKAYDTAAKELHGEFANLNF